MSEGFHGEVNWVDEIEESPVCLMANWMKHNAWIMLDEYYCEQYSAAELRQYERVIKAWGVRPCRSTEEYNRLLRDARQKVAAVSNLQGGFQHEL